MKPRRIAADNEAHDDTRERHALASMKPRRIAADNASNFVLPLHDESSFNEAAANRRG